MAIRRIDAALSNKTDCSSERWGVRGDWGPPHGELPDVRSMHVVRHVDWPHQEHRRTMLVGHATGKPVTPSNTIFLINP
jgi:hypothetical protein